MYLQLNQLPMKILSKNVTTFNNLRKASIMDSSLKTASYMALEYYTTTPVIYIMDLSITASVMVLEFSPRCPEKFTQVNGLMI